MLTQERIGQIAVILLQNKMETAGQIVLNPQEIKRDITNNARKIGIAPAEAAEFAKIIIKVAYDKTIATLDTVIDAKDSWLTNNNAKVEEKEKVLDQIRGH
jgi:hypothetical protein